MKNLLHSIFNQSPIRHSVQVSSKKELRDLINSTFSHQNLKVLMNGSLETLLEQKPHHIGLYLERNFSHNQGGIIVNGKPKASHNACNLIFFDKNNKVQSGSMRSFIIPKAKTEKNNDNFLTCRLIIPFESIKKIDTLTQKDNPSQDLPFKNWIGFGGKKLPFVRSSTTRGYCYSDGEILVAISLYSTRHYAGVDVRIPLSRLFNSDIGLFTLGREYMVSQIETVRQLGHGPRFQFEEKDRIYTSAYDNLKTVRRF